MIADRETIYAAVFAVAAGLAPFVTKSRRLEAANGQVPSTLQPALFMGQDDEVATGPKGAPRVYRLSVLFLLYAYSGDPGLPPATVLNPLVDALDRGFNPQGPEPVQTLGGKVQHAWVGPKPITYYGGVFSPQSIAAVPVEILVGS